MLYRYVYVNDGRVEQCTPGLQTTDISARQLENAMPQSNVGRPSFDETEQALTMTSGQDADLTLSVKKTITLWSILFCITLESVCTR